MAAHAYNPALGRQRYQNCYDCKPAWDRDPACLNHPNLTSLAGKMAQSVKLGYCEEFSDIPSTCVKVGRVCNPSAREGTGGFREFAE